MSFFIRAATLVRGMDGSKLHAQSGMNAEEWARLPCIVGSSSHDIGRVENDAAPQLAPPIEFARSLASAFGVSGPLLSTASACTSGLTALQLALDLLRAGAFQHALVLGAEFRNRLTPAGFASLGLETKLGEALGALIVSTEGPWRLASLAWQMDPSSLTGIAADGSTLAHAMRDALAEAGWQPAEVDLVKLQAENDPAEARALGGMFSPLPKTISLKGALGHTLGASGPAELALLLEALGAERRVLANFSGFGGHLASLALERA